MGPERPPSFDLTIAELVILVAGAVAFCHAPSSEVIGKRYAEELREEDEYHRADYDDLWRVSKGMVVQSAPEVVRQMADSGVNVSSKVVNQLDAQDPLELGAHVFELMKEQQRHKRENTTPPPGLVRVQINSNVPILFVPFSDWHLGNAGTDYLQLDKHIDLMGGLGSSRPSGAMGWTTS